MPDISDLKHRTYIPKRETQAAKFLQQYPEFGGRDVLVAILDTGISPNTPGIVPGQVVDYVDCTGSGDVRLQPVELDNQDGTIIGISGRKLHVPAELVSSMSKICCGILLVERLIPSGLKSRYLKKRKQKLWLGDVNDELRDLYIKRDAYSTQSNEYEDISELIKILSQYQTKEQDPGMLCDCIVWQDVKTGEWKCIIDTSDSHILNASMIMGSYKDTGDIGTFSSFDMMTYTVNLEPPDLLSVVCDAGTHGSHVATICAGLFTALDDNIHPDVSSERNGVAPFAQLLSVKIGDPRTDSMESGLSLARGISLCIDRKVDIINLSYGETAIVMNSDSVLQTLVTKAVREHGIVFVSSSGNAGPALSTVGAPGGCFNDVLGVGAYLTERIAKKTFNLYHKVPSMLYHFSSRGPTTDGYIGPAICAPGSAISGIPNWKLACTQLMSGTSMSSPNAAGCIALLISGLKFKNVPYTPISISRSLKATALVVPQMDPFASGKGLIQVCDAFEHHLRTPSDLLDVGFDISVEPTVKTDYNSAQVGGRGIYIKNAHCHLSPLHYSVSLRPCFYSKCSMDDNESSIKRMIAFSEEVHIKSNVSWIKCPERIIVMNDRSRFEIEIDLKTCLDGVNLGEVNLCIMDRPEIGILKSIPVTVVVPLPLESLEFTLFENETFHVGKVIRNFIAVPSFIKNIIMRFSPLQQHTGSTYPHTTQFTTHAQFHHPSQRSVGTYMKKSFCVKMACTRYHDFCITIPFTPVVIEICVARNWNWSHVEASGLKCSILASSLRAVSSPVILYSSSTFPSFDIATGDLIHKQPSNDNDIKQFTETNNKAYFSIEWIWMYTPLVPIDAIIRPAVKLTEALESIRYFYELCLEYNLQVHRDKSEVSIEVPTISSYLYDSDFLSQSFIILDSTKQIVHCGDVLAASKTKLCEGEYRVQVTLVHGDISVLDGLRNLSVHARQSVSSDMSPRFEYYLSAMHAVAQQNKVNPIAFGLCGVTSVFLRKLVNEKLSENISAGSIFKGVLRAQCQQSSFSSLSLQLADVEYIVTCNAKKSDPSLDDDYLNNDLARAQYITITRTTDDDLVKDIEKRCSNDTSLMLGFLSRYFADFQKSNTSELRNKALVLADSIVALIDTDKFRQRVLALKYDDLTMVKETNNLKSRLVRTLLIKASILINQKDEDFHGHIQNDKSDELTNVFKMLQLYGTNIETNLLTRKFVGQYYWIRSRLGKALSVLKICDNEKVVCEWIRMIYEELGWTRLAKMYEGVMIRRFLVRS
ncbi:hypothetical protein ACOME3_009486 [Neoechinorhynchus agilis]